MGEAGVGTVYFTVFNILNAKGSPYMFIYKSVFVQRNQIAQDHLLLTSRGPLLFLINIINHVAESPLIRSTIDLLRIL